MQLTPSSLEQRESFYKALDVARVEAWFKEHGLAFPQLCALDQGTETGIIKEGGKKNELINIRAGKLKEKFLRYLPEDVYYDRNRYHDVDKVMSELNFKEIWTTDNLIGQQLAFDLDPENIKCACDTYCGKCIRQTVDEALGLADQLEDRFNKIGFMYSGRGMHVHVFDKEAFALSITERDALNEDLRRFPIDPWVSKGYIRLIRLPYSLHGVVSRVVTPLTKKEVEGFNPLDDPRVIPAFLKD